MRYKPNPGKLGIDISIRISAFLLTIILAILCCLPLVSDRLVATLFMVFVACIALFMNSIRRHIVDHLHKRYFDQSLDIDDDLITYRGPHAAVTTSIPISAINIEQTRITPKNAMIPYRRTDGETEMVSIPLYLYDREVFETLEQILAGSRIV